jgi:PAS domain S-box-containing protein
MEVSPLAPIETLFGKSGVAEAMPLALVAWDMESIVVGWNAAAESVFGWTAEEVLGRSFFEFLIPGDAREHVHRIVKSMTSSKGTALHSTNENLTKDGRMILCEWDNGVVRDEDGKPTVFLSMARDVTLLTQAEQAQERLHDIAAAANTARDLGSILLLVRNAMLKVGGFDRVGIWLYSEGALNGTWGTGPAGEVLDEHGSKMEPDQLSPGLAAILNGEQPYSIQSSLFFEYENYTTSSLNANPEFLAIGLVARGEVIGVIFADNHISCRTISKEHVHTLLPFCEQIAMAVANVQLLDERVQMVERQRRLMEIFTAISASSDPDLVLHLVRDAAVSIGGFDRAGVWLLEGDVIRGSWGTDMAGRLRDEHDQSYRLEGPQVTALINSTDSYQIQELPNEEILIGSESVYVQRAIIAMRAGKEMVGILSVDNSISGRQLTDSNVKLLLPFAEQAAFAIRNARLLEEQKRMREHQRRLIQIAIGMNANLGLDAILQMVRDAVVEAGGLDRCGVWLVEGEYARGTWGTDADGRQRDERMVRTRVDEWGPRLQEMLHGTEAFDIIETDSLDIMDPGVSNRITHAIVPMRVNSELIGFLSVDNLFSNRPMNPSVLEPLIPFAEQAAAAIRNARLMEEREQMQERQRRLMQIATGMNANLGLDAILRLVRDAVVDVGGHDRCGVWLVEGAFVRGSWGTDVEGHPRDERDLRGRLDEWGPHLLALLHGNEAIAIRYSAPLGYGDSAVSNREARVTNALVPMRADGELIGFLSVDDLISGRPINATTLSPLLPFAEQAAAAIRNARLMEERKRMRERQRRLNEISAGMNASMELDGILRLVRDAVVAAGGFDRAGVFLLDRETSIIRGTWGTDRSGQPEDISSERFPFDQNITTPMRRVLNGEIPFSLVNDFTSTLQIEPENRQFGVKHHAVVPLKTAGEIVGVICVDNLLTGHIIRETDIEGLLPFAEQAAIAIHNAQLFRQLAQTQETLIRSEKMRALGELASGVAHNINNVLTAVLGYSELIRGDANVTAQIAHYARVIERAGLDGAEIVQRVQQFASKETSDMTVSFDLSAAVQDALDLARPAWLYRHQESGKGIEVITEIQPVFAQGVASEIREVIVNLIKNAVDAMPEGGTLTIRCRKGNGEAVVEVQDTGIGMDEGIRKRVFEPFFTTKGPALGTGLGLSLSWGVIQRHKGSIDVDSEPGQGARFTVKLPQQYQPDSNEIHLSEAKIATDTLSGLRILLVDDEPLVVESVARMLVGKGAQIEIADNAEGALSWLTTHSGKCDLAISDHGMAGMPGSELLAIVKREYPDIRRILLTGWGAEVQLDDGGSSAEIVLGKPLKMSALIEAILSLDIRN